MRRAGADKARATSAYSSRRAIFGLIDMGDLGLLYHSSNKLNGSDSSAHHKSEVPNE
jgi:hypothetical protein